MTSVAKPSIVQLTKAFAVAGAFVALGCGTSQEKQGPRLWEQQGEAQGTTFTIKYVSDAALSEGVVETVLEDVDIQMNAWRPESALSRFNAFAKTDTEFWIDDESNVWSELWSISEEVHHDSEGAFDVAVAPLMKLWGFRTEHRNVVTDAMVDSVRAFARFDPEVVSFQANQVDGSNGMRRLLIKHDARAALDFNAVAQGYTVDRIAEALVGEDIVNFMVELGGEVRCMGTNGKGAPWRIAIDRPQEEGRTLQAILSLDDMSVCTSGNYRKVAIVNGQKVSHTIDPRTSRPVTHGLLSATIVCPRAAYADAYATVCMVLGPKEGAEWIENLRRQGAEIEALFIIDGGGSSFEYWATEGLENNLEWLEALPAYGNE